MYLILCLYRPHSALTAYRNRLTMPKLAVAGTSDGMNLLDDSHYWYNQMTQPMYLLLVSTAYHFNHRVFPSAIQVVVGL